jgi:hypothetical protein
MSQMNVPGPSAAPAATMAGRNTDDAAAGAKKFNSALGGKKPGAGRAGSNQQMTGAGSKRHADHSDHVHGDDHSHGDAREGGDSHHHDHVHGDHHHHHHEPAGKAPSKSQQSAPSRTETNPAVVLTPTAHTPHMETALAGAGQPAPMADAQHAATDGRATAPRMPAAPQMLSPTPSSASLRSANGKLTAPKSRLSMLPMAGPRQMGPSLPRPVAAFAAPSVPLAAHAAPKAPVAGLRGTTQLPLAPQADMQAQASNGMPTAPTPWLSRAPMAGPDHIGPSMPRPMAAYATAPAPLPAYAAPKAPVAGHGGTTHLPLVPQADMQAQASNGMPTAPTPWLSRAPIAGPDHIGPSMPRPMAAYATAPAPLPAYAAPKAPVAGHGGTTHLPLAPQADMQAQASNGRPTAPTPRLSRAPIAGPDHIGPSMPRPMAAYATAPAPLPAYAAPKAPVAGHGGTTHLPLAPQAHNHGAMAMPTAPQPEANAMDETPEATMSPTGKGNSDMALGAGAEHETPHAIIFPTTTSQETANPAMTQPVAPKPAPLPQIGNTASVEPKPANTPAPAMPPAGSAMANTMPSAEPKPEKPQAIIFPTTPGRETANPAMSQPAAPKPAPLPQSQPGNTASVKPEPAKTAVPSTPQAIDSGRHTGPQSEAQALLREELPAGLKTSSPEYQLVEKVLAQGLRKLSRLAMAAPSGPEASQRPANPDKAATIMRALKAVIPQHAAFSASGILLTREHDPALNAARQVIADHNLDPSALGNDYKAIGILDELFRSGIPYEDETKGSYNSFATLVPHPFE